ncbi:baseplate J/gp47 family protein [Herbaspirillum chlorophenolicum]|uniref:baseplate J/gp47 family protein n=1 Tax=Herbaspirillum chlorophenolicum TaxID=211589 RepID=UPI0009E33F1A|nr:baseplate J/gp47 family protein [Herbaspirillum chlorophenolicum]
MRNLIIRDGTSQTMRALPALQDGYFNLDEMSFHDLLTMVAEFASLVCFYNAENQPDGDWKPFFHADETVVMSRILAFNLAGAVAHFDDWWRGTPEHTGIGADGRNHAQDIQALPVTYLATTIDGWYVAMLEAQSENGLALRTLIESVIVQLRSDKSGFLDSLRQEGVRLPLAPLWWADTDAAIVPDGGRRPQALLTKTMVRTDFHAYLKAIEMIRKEARARLPASLLSQQHDPAIGMLIAFVRQFQKLKVKLNRFTQNYLDFYYDKMLGSVPQPVAPDRTWVVLTKSPAVREVLVPAQTGFLAGLDEASRDIVYASANDLVVNDARVIALQTVYFDHNRYSAPENRLSDDRPAAAATNGTTATVATTATTAARTWSTAAWFNSPMIEGVMADLQQAYPILGAPKNSSVQNTFADARIGFALASKVLLLKEGLRKISVTIAFDDDMLAQRLARLVPVMCEDDGSGDAALDEIRRQDVFLKVFRRIFQVAVTGEHGWLEIPDYLPAYDDRALTLSFELPPQEPSVVAYDPALHGEQYAVATPMIRFIINPGAYLYPYGMLRDLTISGAHIDVQVNGCRDLVLQNNIGQLSAAAPFAPFGPLPKLGSYLVVGNTEMAGKQISEFSVEVEWADLTRLNGGFATYYDGYEVEVANDDFLATVGVLAKGSWTPAAEQTRPTVQLFRADVQPGQGERLNNRVTWNCNRVAHLFEPDSGVSIKKPLTYGPGAKNGFFKFTLASPAFGFGHETYPHLLSATLVANARTKRLRRQRPVPRTPYTPQINSISISYRADSAIHIDRKTVDGSEHDDQFIHLYPSGWEALGVASYPAAALLPRFDFAGNLYIGIAAQALSGQLTLFFQLREDSLPLPSDAPLLRQPGGIEAGLHWFYLSGNEWKTLPKNALISDGTQNFMTSGIVTLLLPADIGADNSVMPAGSYWLRVSADHDLEKYCSLYAVHAQAVEVRRGADVSPQVPMVLPATAITRSLKPLPGITGIGQPVASTGGRAAETRAQLRTRVSERLRHKDRAVSAADYEALILQYFPEVYKVKCFANLATDRGPDNCIRPGHALVVPLPYWPAVTHQDQMPMLNGNLMQEIRQFLQELASPWSSISVENPVYEKIQVRCKVKFIGGMSNGHHINQLNREISDFLTPWQDGRGYRTHFGWRIRQHDLEAFIGDLPYVESLSGFSMLRIASSDTVTYSLFDTAAAPDVTDDHCADITPLCPWSIAIPAVRHAIEAIDDSLLHDPVRTALSNLEIGSTFIIPKNENDQQINGAA